MIAAVTFPAASDPIYRYIVAAVLGVGAIVFLFVQMRRIYLAEIAFWKNEVARQDKEIDRLHRKMVDMITMSSSMRYTATRQTTTVTPEERQRRAEEQKRKRRAEKVRNLARNTDNVYEAALAKDLAKELSKPKPKPEETKKAS